MMIRGSENSLNWINAYVSLLSSTNLSQVLEPLPDVPIAEPVKEEKADEWMPPDNIHQENKEDKDPWADWDAHHDDVLEWKVFPEQLETWDDWDAFREDVLEWDVGEEYNDTEEEYEVEIEWGGQDNSRILLQANEAEPPAEEPPKPTESDPSEPPVIPTASEEAPEVLETKQEFLYPLRPVEAMFRKKNSRKRLTAEEEFQMQPQDTELDDIRQSELTQKTVVVLKQEAVAMARERKKTMMYVLSLFLV